MDEICIRIKELRTRKGLTLKELADMTDLSVSFLSQIERGTTSLAINSLRKIAEAFEVDIIYFFEKQKKEKYVVRKHEQTPYEVKGLESIYHRLNGEFPNRSLAPFIIKLRPKIKGKQKFNYYGEEFYYVLKGTVIFTVGEEEYIVEEGDSIHFPSNVPHFGENPLDVETVLLCVITPVIF
ncbi:helix-turn-helix domain-containing protein [Bacillus sp. B-jedd]|uniref:helix-turn-helix domain-containing protein n=1 Tax=Bacillus sp. B-jedd TaxID=1476857 RepID=UPI0005156190|nr:XRE family transcriptional regulator [Bacillus sp. B-jedd]CEG28715.1 XRE family transcriptional regulator [Bacillus sp. B-jedd]